MYKNFISAVLIFLLIILNLQPVAAIYYAQKESNFLYSGFMFMQLDDGKFGQCGVNMMDQYTGVTAAHCLDGVDKVFVVIGEVDPDTVQQKALKVSEFNISPNYNDYDFSMYPGIYDVGVVKLSDPVNLEEYGRFESPAGGCGYFMVGYGLNEEGQTLERRSTDVCIKNIADHSFELDFEGNSHFCNGDSGSGIYEKNSGNIVGVTSAYFTEITKKTCVGASAYIVARLDYNQDFLSQHVNVQPTISEIPTEEPTNLPKDYFGEYYPETKKPDGQGYNYENELLLEIEKLSEMFDSIYPEEGANNIDEPDVVGDDENIDEDQYGRPLIPENDSSENERMIVPVPEGGVFSNYLMIIALCAISLCCIVIMFVGFIVLIMRNRSKQKTTPVSI